MAVLFLCSLISAISVIVHGQHYEGIIGPMDVCERDTFNATCPPGHVILMEDALYGRMTSSRCVQNSVADGSCNTDVMAIMDGLCSGRETCQVPGIYPGLVFSKKCSLNIAFLRASYQCIKATRPATAVPCNNTPIAVEIEDEGYIPLSLLADHQTGSSNCPLLIPGSKDKLFNLTLWSFHDNAKLSNDACFEVGMLREKTRETPIVSCQGEARRKSLLTSSGASISLHFYNIKSLEKIGTFMLQYQASQQASLASAACPDPDLPRDASFARHDNQVTVICDVTHTTWRLTCVEGEWQGELGDCETSEENNADMSEIESHLAFSLGLLAVLSIGVALILFLGGFIFYVLCFSCKRVKRGSADKYMKSNEVNFLYPYHTKLSHSDGSDPRSDYSRAPLFRPVTADDTVSDHTYMIYDRDYRPITPTASPQSTRSNYMPLSHV